MALRERGRSGRGYARDVAWSGEPACALDADHGAPDPERQGHELREPRTEEYAAGLDRRPARSAGSCGRARRGARPPWARRTRPGAGRLLDARGDLERRAAGSG